MIGLLIIVFICPLLSVIDFIAFLFNGRRFLNIAIIRIVEICSFIILPYMYISSEGYENKCCTDTTAFSPGHQLTIWTIIMLSLAAYFYSSYRKKIATPVLEILINGLLFICIVLNIFIAIHTDSFFLAIAGNLSIILLTILAIIKNQRLFIESVIDIDTKSSNRFEATALKLLSMRPMVKFPVILVLCLPLLFILISILLLIGQKPDSIIRAFTDTYRHGFSQWDYKCLNVQCGGHYLCSVAANGHKKIVKPQRLGVRNSHMIICNRQLLVSNAFEDLIQERFPSLHKSIRKRYDQVGDFIHRYYFIFENKFISDLIYIMMKPAEWFFVFILYTFDRKPENRIAKQYISIQHRQKIDQL